jgi:hypothetical protein
MYALMYVSVYAYVCMFMYNTKRARHNSILATSALACMYVRLYVYTYIHTYMRLVRGCVVVYASRIGWTGITQRYVGVGG